MKITISGDFSPTNRLALLIDNENYSAIFENVKQLFADSDFNIVNFESTIPSRDDECIEKIGPNLRCSPNSIDALDWAGINVVTLANNHAGDYGPDSLVHTISLFQKRGIHYVGAGKNIDEAGKILYLNKGEEILAVINCCEHEYGIANKEIPGTNPLNPIAQYYAIQEAQNKADYVIIIIHGGPEQFQLPTLRMQETYRFFIDAGADAVINHHQHCFSGLEMYNGKPIYYGLGNFAFDYHNGTQLTTEGIIVSLDLNKDIISHKYLPYVQFRERPGIHFVKDTLEIDRKIEELSKIISDRDKLNSHINKYFEDWQSIVEGRLQPYSGRILNGLYSRGMLPSLLSKNNKRLLQNMVNCETHRERLQFFLDKN